MCYNNTRSEIQSSKKVEFDKSIFHALMLMCVFFSSLGFPQKSAVLFARPGTI